MPTTPMASAIGNRRNASTSMNNRPMSDSLMAPSGRRLGGARSARREHLEYVHHAGEGDHRGHEVDERPDGDAQHVGGVPVAVDLARLDPGLPREEEHKRGAHGMHQADPGVAQAARKDAVN